MYKIEFYEKPDGTSDIWDFLEKLRQKAHTNKDARIQLKQIRLHIQLLQENGTRLPNNITKHLVEDIWELRPGNNRVFILLSQRRYFRFAPSFQEENAKNSNVRTRKSKTREK